ncbi:integrase-recombinase protein : Site-specific recombinase XerD OS=Singulisphaera acidiphila (strain ATCC BAA-1392 / DSM 18658 / VKM B-2454 / MOB10) GN=Sinac_4560 PE=4 SV=1: Phage_integrase [Gemmata massiliana]|uniref:Tyr recombinase domain-containing protein n=1 Tax=Gemmata massiliana TaxID=1210884 RepID=A0A6P2DIK8_9BACT|nr:site-specific integrase [Gemmata massiliana]VTS01768.1 integrase-recombinase protein : Site-specific recombinase XerD OS=Singulisphaera acidiphila (strain ATCC BAA-1392 / DSM 18658 / VKM B-2454 / MOB10) GN=Sinac_4560 PE=4 SV=1: Phage_integrase [Gemmata massiliana]
MAHVHKQTFTKAIPTGAERVTIKGRACVRWRGRTKNWQVGELIPDKPGRCRIESSKWYVTYFDPSVNDTRTVPGYADRAATDALMVTLVRTAERVDAGVLPKEAARPRLTLPELLDRWHRYVRHSGASEDGARRQWRRAQDVCDGLKVTRVSELTPTTVLDWIGTQRVSGGRAPKGKQGKGISSGTAANYIGAIKSFTRWCALVERCEAVDHLSALVKSRDPADLRHVRRALMPVELDRLLSAAQGSTEVIYGLTGTERHALYLVACSTGLRATELSRLEPEHVDVTKNTVTVWRPAKTKTRPADVLPLDADVLKVLKPLLKGRGPLWPNRGKPTQAWWRVGARLVRHDLAAADLPAKDAQGRVFDFHSLRGQFGTDLDRAGVSLVRAQKLMRHSTPDLTAKYYMRPESVEMAADVAKLKRGRKGENRAS